MNKKPYRVVIVSAVDGARRNLRNMLIRLGLRVVGEAKDAAAGVRIMVSVSPDLIIIEDVTEGWPEVLLYAEHHEIAPVLLIVSDKKNLAVQKVAWMNAAGILVRPFTRQNLEILTEYSILSFRHRNARKKRAKKADAFQGVFQETLQKENQL